MPLPVWCSLHLKLGLLFPNGGAILCDEIGTSAYFALYGFSSVRRANARNAAEAAQNNSVDVYSASAQRNGIILTAMAEDYVVTSRRPDQSRGFRVGLALFGVICSVIATLTMEEKSLGLLFGLAFSLAWWTEIARRLPIVVGGLGVMAFLVAGAYRVGWESVIFLLLFLALWRIAGDERSYRA